jgi:hypothetical protein
LKSNDQSGFQEEEKLPEISVTTWSTGMTELRDYVLARLGFKRMQHLVMAGLFSIGHPVTESPVFYC